MYRVCFDTVGSHKTGDIVTLDQVSNNQRGAEYLLKIGAIEPVAESPSEPEAPVEGETDTTTIEPVAESPSEPEAPVEGEGKKRNGKATQ
jgi:hypothetical protein